MNVLSDDLCLQISIFWKYDMTVVCSFSFKQARSLMRVDGFDSRKYKQSVLTYVYIFIALSRRQHLNYAPVGEITIPIRG